jgi:hypothetical protein
MFIDNLSLAPIAVYHICYTPAVKRQNHSLKNIWKYVYCIIYDTKCSEGLKWAGESCPAPFVIVQIFIYNSFITGRRMEGKCILMNFVTSNSQKM